MPRYYHSTSYHHQRRFIKKIRKLLVGILIVLLLGGAVVLIDSLRTNEKATQPSANTQVTTTTVAPSVKIFRSSHFQFQAPKSWVEIAGETTQQKFVYRSFQGSLIQQELNIYLNPTDIPQEPNYVLPVTLQDNDRLQPNDVSEHCGKGVPAAAPKDPQKITFAEVSFTCSPDSRGYVVIVGEKNGDTMLQLSRPDGTTTDYLIVYRNVTATPDARELVEIIESFQTR